MTYVSIAVDFWGGNNMGC